MAKQQLVLAFFANEASADGAVNAIKQWDKASKEIKLGAIGVLVKDDKGKIKTHKLGSRKTGTGAVLFALAGLLSGGMTVVGGAVIGAIVGSLFHKGLGMSKEDLARIGGELDGGKAAVAILADPQEAPAVSAKLAELGGKPESHELSEEVVQEAETAAAEMPEEAPAAEAEEAPAAEAEEPPAAEAEEAPADEEGAKPAAA
jgi:uncharacterized membrane protein